MKAGAAGTRGAAMIPTPLPEDTLRRGETTRSKTKRGNTTRHEAKPQQNEAKGNTVFPRTNSETTKGQPTTPPQRACRQATRRRGQPACEETQCFRGRPCDAQKGPKKAKKGPKRTPQATPRRAADSPPVSSQRRAQGTHDSRGRPCDALPGQIPEDTLPETKRGRPARRQDAPPPAATRRPDA